LREAKRRGMRAPVLAMGDGALGFWSALREVFPTTREQRCWFHKIANVLAALPKSAHPGAKKALAEIWSAEDGEHAEVAAKAFQDAYGAKFPKAVAKIVDDLEELLAFYDFPAEHWIHLHTTNPIESTFATVRHRTKVTKGPGSNTAGAPSTHHTWSPSSAPARSSNEANSSNVRRHDHQVRPPKPHDQTFSSTGLDNCSCEEIMSSRYGVSWGGGCSSSRRGSRAGSGVARRCLCRCG